MEHLWGKDQTLTCIMCGAVKSAATEKEDCPLRSGAPPRARPPSFDSDPGWIGERSKYLHDKDDEWMKKPE